MNLNLFLFNVIWQICWNAFLLCSTIQIRTINRNVWSEKIVLLKYYGLIFKDITRYFRFRRKGDKGLHGLNISKWFFFWLTIQDKHAILFFMAPDSVKFCLISSHVQYNMWIFFSLLGVDKIWASVRGGHPHLLIQAFI